MADTQQYLIPKFHFEVSWADSSDLICSEVTGLNTEVQSIEYRDGKSDAFHVVKRPGMQKFGDVSLKKAIFQSDVDFKTWFDKVAVRTDDSFRDTVSIILKNDNHEAVITWTLENAWVSKFTMPDMNSTANEPAVESITIVCESIIQEFS